VSGNEWTARLEVYSTDGTVPDNLLIGTNQAGRKIYPDLNAVIFQLGYRFGR
jgi:hypothetical protein